MLGNPLARHLARLALLLPTPVLTPLAWPATAPRYRTRRISRPGGGSVAIDRRAARKARNRRRNRG